MDTVFKIKRITVLGAGTMGQTIAYLFSENGIPTTLYDADNRVIDDMISKRGHHENLRLTKRLETAVSESDLIVESVPEIFNIKREVFLTIAPHVKQHAIIASNTSSFPLHVLSEGLPFSQRMMLIHFFNPADLIPLVELVKPPAMADAIVNDLISLLKTCGKIPVLLKRDINGFIANRLQAALLREACNLLQQGVAEVSDIDTVVKQSIGLRWALNGPFEITDLGGLDVWEKVLTNILPDLDNTTSVPLSINQLVNNNNLGLKTNKGFYDYHQSASNQAVLQREKLARLLKDIK